jgi:hypothetical protein
MATWRFPQEWLEWVEWMGAGLHGRCRWRLPIVLSAMLFATGRRTVASWLRAAAVGAKFSGYYYFIAAVGRKAKPLAGRLLTLLLRQLPTGDHVLLALDDTPTERYGPKVQGAGIHHNPTPGPADAKFVYGHIWVTAGWIVRHPLWGTIGLPLLAALYVRQKDIAHLPAALGWQFRTKLQQGVGLVFWAWMIVAEAGKRLWVVADGAYAKRPFLKPLRTLLGVTVVSRLRKDAALRDVPSKPKKGQRRGRGRPRIYGRKRLSLAKRAAAKRGWQTIECVQYGKTVTKKYKTFLATYRPACGMIRVVIVQEPDGCEYFFSTDPAATVREILEAFADRSAVEQVFHDIKEVWGAGKQQLRYLWANIGAYHLNLWMHTLVELWAWGKSKAQLCDRRDSPWDDPERRPSHADRRKALQRLILRREYWSLLHSRGAARKIAAFARRLLKMAL